MKGIKRIISMDSGSTGILTFHCADNYGAMLQAYGLKEYLNKKGIDAVLVRYEPPFMTGRHWWVPYIPKGDPIGIIRRGWNGWRRNLGLGGLFFERRRNMRQFRRKYLIRKGQKKIFFASQFKNLPYQYYIVGSDQIWNPEITLGLRKVYFGNFVSKSERKVIAYAASLGGASLAAKYDEEFSELIKTVDHISVRESAAVPYIRQFYKKEIFTVPDPVFLLHKEEWQKIEKLPDKKRYIFVYMTENNDVLLEYVKKLAEREKLMILKMKGGQNLSGENVVTDYIAGPAEFLGYIHRADYVVTNSFHGVAFSIIFQKAFTVFPHSSVGTRISNILMICGLENRLYSADGEPNSVCLLQNQAVDWKSVERRIEKKVELAERYLLEGLNG